MGDRSAWERLKARLELEESEVATERQIVHWVDEAVKEFEQNGGMEYVKGKGKPLKFDDGDAIHGVLKTANFKPPWLELQHEIRDALQDLLKEIRQHTAVRPEETLAAINKKIARFNAIAPHYSMQKAPVALESLERQTKAWE